MECTIFDGERCCRRALLLAASPVQAAESALVRAVQAGDQAAVRALVKQRARGQGDRSPTARLRSTGRRAAAMPARCDLLIRAGADVNAKTRYGVTPLALAVRAGHDSAVRALLTAGAKVPLADAGLPEGQTLLMHAARTGNVPAMKALARRRRRRQRQGNADRDDGGGVGGGRQPRRGRDGCWPRLAPT